MGTFKRIAPIFPVRDVRISLEYYGRLGFATREYEHGGYGFVTRDGIELHLGEAPDVSNSRPASAYLWVEDADELAKTWIFDSARRSSRPSRRPTRHHAAA